jgi:hypothetical protein
MRIELEVAGYQVQFVSINVSGEDGIVTQERLVDRCSFPLLQDNEALDIWNRMGGKKDDFYIFDAEGNLARYFPFGSPSLSLNLSTAEGYDTIKGAILEVVDGVARRPTEADTQTSTESDIRESDAGTSSDIMRDEGPDVDTDGAASDEASEPQEDDAQTQDGSESPQG